MIQDETGFMWFATKNGLFRYDGSNLHSYHHHPSDSNSLASDAIEAITLDEEGNIWLATLGAGLDCFDPSTSSFTHYRHLPENSQSIGNDWVTAVLADHSQKLWIGTSAGLCQMDLRTHKFTHFEHVPGDSNSISSNEVVNIYEDKSGTIWIGTGSVYSSEAGHPEVGGLNRFNSDAKNFTRYLHDPNNSSSLINNKVKAICEDSKGNFWVGTAGDGLHIMNRSTGSFQRLTYDPAHPEKPSRPPLSQHADYGRFDHITFIIEDTTHNIWIGSAQSGINCYNPETRMTTYIGSEFGSPGNYVDITSWAAYSSKNGVLWLSSISGDLYSVNTLHKNIPFIPIPGALVNAFYKQQDGILWVGTQNKGLYRINSNHEILDHFEHEPGNPNSLSQNWVSSIAADAQGSIWISSHNGLHLWDHQLQSFIRIRLPSSENDSFLRNWILHMTTDQEGNLWLSTLGGLVCRNGQTGKFQTYLFHNGDSTKSDNNRIVYAMEDPAGNIWASVNSNLIDFIKLDPQSGEFESYFTGIKLFQLIYDPFDSTIWMGGAQVVQFDPKSKTLKRFVDKQSQLPIVSNHSLIIDQQRHLWTGSTHGLVRVNLQNQEVLRVFGKNYGVNGDEISDVCSLVTDDNTVYFGSYSGGYYEFKPVEIIRGFYPPALAFSSFKLANKIVMSGSDSPIKEALTKAKEILLDHDQNVFSFQFTAIDFIDAENNRQYYKLEKYDENWNMAGPDKRAFYFKVPPGEYTFRVKAANSNGLWTEKSIAVIIAAPWWSHWWVWLMAGILLVLGIYRITRWRMHQQFSQQLRVSVQEKELAELRNKAADLEMQALRSQMNPHFIFNSLNSINRFILRNNRTAASEYLTKFSRLIRLILQNSQAAMISLESELDALQLYLDLEVLRFNDQFEYHINLQPGLDAEMLKVPPLIIQPFAENSIWHGLMHKEEKGRLDIEITREDEQLVFRITDDGIGRTQAKALASKSATKRKSMGLQLTNSRLAMLQQQGQTTPVVINDLMHADGTAAGTEVVLKIPVRYD